MIERTCFSKLLSALQTVPVVALLGSRQVGKTTLALAIETALEKTATYLDLELDSDFNKLTDPESYLSRFSGELLIIDEVQRKPDLFRILRGLVDIRRRAGEPAGQFLLLGSASRDLLQQSSESLAGRIRYLELSPFTVIEIQQADPLASNLEKLWFRGGFPDSYLAPSEAESWHWRSDFISTYVERDIPLMGPQIPATKLRRFWTMLAHYHGQQVILSELGRSLEVSHTTARNYLDTLTDFYMVRQIQPWSGNTKKRLVKSPKIYLRDSGLLHRLLNISEFDTLLGNPILGASWEGFVIENIILTIDDRWQFSYYRSSGQAEIDLVLETPLHEVWAIEVKRGAAPKPKRGFYEAAQDIGADKKFVVYSGTERYPLPNEVEVIGLIEFLSLISNP
ncbi:ATP-binding protein [Sphingobacterium olei]|uniref:ATP-binding protein n=1 Tax=Sphingobacterium olei TaxID=2571155 RepID=A0A4U0NZ67_9SPHI|nr:ATP-binding protein [Sphingobacterium olei]TJZ60113.1 ATP-binding protein [Sphingobacterium olei]